jgi:hypothetical protein
VQHTTHTQAGAQYKHLDEAAEAYAEAGAARARTASGVVVAAGDDDAHEEVVDCAAEGHAEVEAASVRGNRKGRGTMDGDRTSQVGEQEAKQVSPLCHSYHWSCGYDDYPFRQNTIALDLATCIFCYSSRASRQQPRHR